MGLPRKQRRNPHGSGLALEADRLLYDTLPGTKKRMPLFDESGERCDKASSAAHRSEAIAGGPPSPSD